MLGGAPGRVDSRCGAWRMPGVERLVMLPAYAGSTAGFAVVAQDELACAAGGRCGGGRLAAASGAAPLDSASNRRPSCDAARPSRGRGTFVHERGDVPTAEAGGSAARSLVPRALSRARHDGADELHRAGARRTGRDLGSDPGARAWPAPWRARRRCAARPGDGACHVARRRFRPAAGGRLRRPGGAGRDGLRRRAGAAAVVARGGHAPRLLPAGRRRMLRASLDADGQVRSLRIKSAGDAISPRWLERALPALSGPVDPPDKTTAEGLFDQPYAVRAPAHRARGYAHAACRSASGARSATRTTPSSSESFVDELAAEADAGPARTSAAPCWMRCAAPPGGAAPGGREGRLGRQAGRWSGPGPCLA